VRALFAVIVSLAMAGHGCASANSPVAGSATPPDRATGFLPARCEQRADDLYRPVVPATIERLGTRPVLTVACDGTHSIYIKPGSTVDPTPLIGQPVCVRYRYVVEPRPAMPCLRPPCPDRERVVDIVEARLTSRAAGCPTP
jgi:hypothetical protein